MGVCPGDAKIKLKPVACGTWVYRIESMQMYERPIGALRPISFDISS
jgi:hypothetical protein